MVVLVLNAGSSSLKIDLIDAEAGQTLAAGQVERIGAVSSLASFRLGDAKAERVSLQAPDHTTALGHLLDRMRERLLGVKAADKQAEFDLRMEAQREQIKAKVKELNIPRYKVVVQVTLGENKGQGVRVASRCLWDHKTDNYATLTYKNERYFACAVVFGCYTE